MSIRLNNKIIAGGVGANTDKETIRVNNQGALTAIGVKPKQGETMYDWVGTLAEYERGRNNKTIPDNWVCWITDDAEFGPTISQEQVDSFLTKNQITNCITEIPQRIKFELTDTTLTIKAGSQVIIPNGFEEDGITPKFDYVNIENDIIKEVTPSTTGCCLPWYDVNNKQIMGLFSDGTNTYYYSGTEQPTTNYAYWYDTTNNIVKFNNNGTWTEGTYSLPFASVSYINTGSFTSIDQVFNGIGYIGSTVWVDKGVKGLIPDGRNEDGSLKNIEVTTDKLLQFQVAWATPNVMGDVYISNDNTITLINISKTFYTSETPTVTQSGYNIWYNPYTNLWKKTTDEGLTWETLKQICVARFSIGSTAKQITKLNTIDSVDLLKRNDKSEISGWAMPSDKYIDLTLGASGTAYTAPANGYFYLDKVAGSDWYYISMKNEMSGVDLFVDAYRTSPLTCIIPAKKSENVFVHYNATGETNCFRFIYAEGEQ